MKKFDKNVFAERAADLINKSGKLLSELKDTLHISMGTLSDLKNKKGAVPNAETICALAQHFNVSTDWLLGLSEVRSTDKATKEMCATLGLSETAITILKGEYTPLNLYLKYDPTSNNEPIDPLLERSAIIDTINELLAEYADYANTKPQDIPFEPLILLLSNFYAYSKSNDTDLIFDTSPNKIMVTSLFNKKCEGKGCYVSLMHDMPSDIRISAREFLLSRYQDRIINYLQLRKHSTSIRGLRRNVELFEKAQMCIEECEDADNDK